MTGAEPGEARSHFTRRARGQRSAARRHVDVAVRGGREAAAAGHARCGDGCMTCISSPFIRSSSLGPCGALERIHQCV